MAEIEFTAWTAAGGLRHPSYKGLRDDKQAARSCARTARRPCPRPVERQAAARTGTSAAKLAIDEQGANKATTTVEGRELKLSNLSKLLYPQAALQSVT